MMKNKEQISKVLVENAITHKETIEPKLFNDLNNKAHYNSKNFTYPDTVGRGNYLLDIAQRNFKNILNKTKVAFNVNDINPQKFFSLQGEVKSIINKISNIEKNYSEQLNTLAENIVREEFNVPNSIVFTVNGEEVDGIDGDNVLDNFCEEQMQIKFDSYNNIENQNLTIDRKRMNYCLTCGCAHNTMKLYKSKEEELFDIDYRLIRFYDLYLKFNDFCLWVIPDEILSNIDEQGGFNIYESGEQYIISIESSNFLSTLYEMTKAIMSILFQVKYNNPHVDYNSPWNIRLGAILWDKFKKCVPYESKISNIIDTINDLDNTEYGRIFKEVFSETEQAKEIFKYGR